jgi:hypothetical protein
LGPISTVTQREFATVSPITRAERAGIHTKLAQAEEPELLLQERQERDELLSL